MAPKSIPKVIFSSSEHWSSYSLIFLPIVFHGFWGPSPPKNLPKCNQIASESHSKFHWFFMLLFVGFYWNLASNLDPIFLKNRSKWGGRVKHHRFFLIFQMFYLLAVPPGPDLVDFGWTFYWFGSRFEWISAPKSRAPRTMHQNVWEPWNS